ncbi:extra-cytoplasmic solute receptor BugT (plasmid) [Cupriavidus necator N-1]|uniref:Extra-cytoplasmic solute receptor BugT n=1 Tax=Cupriavidus necator (strain ATCC 43291 / DSM 13513 / CCUG 52238 / LMG 8453 / N-1) TaxID=1042878 RepID=F8GUL9_CUPNN|nr:tripartite tricarboxylate transporter substrate binding protein [Cupriavidus necator]AEI82423.1 extra-cytoplasmic solute receptor BugT [Cupriavidus necator N-1]MDX6007433.1 tripartite tricarboxylate transporter substrate binding protein [Cupriavidus necator]
MNRPVRMALACLLFGVSLAHAAASDTYPSKPVTIVVPQAPGGTNDIVARILGAALSQSTGQQFIVDNRPGAGGNIGSQYAARANPDGYTVLLTISSTQAINPALYKKIPFDPVKDFDPVALVASVPNVLVAHPSFPASNMKDLIALAKSKPNELRYGSAGNGSLNHLLGEMLNNMAGISLEHVPYKGVGPALNDLLGNQIPLAFASLPSVLPHIKAGKLKALGVSSAKRSSAAPDIPAIAETIPNYSGDLWVALFAVHGTPKDVVSKLTTAVDKVLDDKSVQEKLKAQGAELPRATPQQLSGMLKSDMEKWAKIVKTSGATVD